MTRHTLRDLMRPPSQRDILVAFQGVGAFIAFVGVYSGDRDTIIAGLMGLFLSYALTPSRLPPRNERGQFSKRD